MKFMRFRHYLITFALIALFVGMFSNISTANAAFGISPPWVENDHMLPGTTYEQIINMSRNKTDKEMKVTVMIKGDEDLVEWIQIQDEENLIMEKGQNVLPMKVIIDVPERATLKNYLGNIYVSLVPLVADTAMEGGQISVNLGVNISVDITVTGEEVIDYQIESVSINQLQEGDPFSINVEVENLGNTEISDIKGQVDIYENTGRTEILKSLDFLPLSESVSSDETKISEMVFEDIVLDPGKYWIVPKTFKDGEIVYKNGLVLEIEGTTTQKPALPSTTKEAEVTQ